MGMPATSLSSTATSGDRPVARVGRVVRADPGSERVVIRALRPGDLHLLEVILDGLGPESRLLRFLAPRPVLTARDLSVTARVDGIDHVGVIALAGSQAVPVGAAHYVRSEHPEIAEAAIEVVDAWQRRGIGRLLIAELRVRAARAGIRSFTWSAFASNQGVAALTRDLSDHRRAHVGGGVMEWSASI